MRYALLTLLLAQGLVRASDYRVTANIHYDRDYPETVLDIVQSRAPAMTDHPGAIVIHGGGWIGGAKEDMLERFCAPLVQHDFVVANVEYRLAKSATAPAAVSDVLRAARWFRDHAAEYHVDAKRIIVVGESAGGHLALMTGFLPPDSDLGPTVKVAAIVDFSGISDVSDLVSGANQRPYADTWLPEQTGRMALARKLSPLAYIRKALPPVLAIQSQGDAVVPYAQSERLIQALKAQHDDAELITVPGDQHLFDEDELGRLWQQVFKWLKKRKLGN